MKFCSSITQIIFIYRTTRNWQSLGIFFIESRRKDSNKTYFSITNRLQLFQNRISKDLIIKIVRLVIGSHLVYFLFNQNEGIHTKYTFQLQTDYSFFRNRISKDLVGGALANSHVSYAISMQTYVSQQCSLNFEKTAVV